MRTLYFPLSWRATGLINLTESSGPYKKTGDKYLTYKRKITFLYELRIFSEHST